jgi:hypothetical protein
MAAADAVTGMESRLAETAPGDSPTLRRALSTALTCVSVGPKVGPNCPGLRKWWNSGDFRSESPMRSALSPD